MIQLLAILSIMYFAQASNKPLRASRASATFTAILSILLLSSIGVQTRADWTPSFVDNFDGSELSHSKWVRGQENLDRQLQSYRDEAIEVSDGKLKLKVLNRPYGGRPYTAGAVTTQGVFAQKYGYFEVRAKLAKGAGLWPAFWLMPDTGKWSSEIDIFEYVGNHPRSLHHSMHYDNRLQLKNTGVVKDAGMDLSETWNVYALHWGPGYIRYLINGQVTHEVKDAMSVSKANDAMFVMLNTALASQHTGWIDNVTENTDFDQTFEIDYVRVYRESASGTYRQIPRAADYVANTSDRPYDSVAISVRSLDTGTPSLMRQPGYIKDTIRLTSHAANIEAKVWISLHKANRFHDNGRYDHEKVQIIEKKVPFSRVGQTQDIAFEFNDVLINSPGVYHVDIVVRDPVQIHNNRAAARYKTFQYLDKTKRSEAVHLDGFIRSGSALVAGDNIEVDTVLQMQEAWLTPALKARYRVMDGNRKVMGSVTEKIVDFDQIGLMSFSHTVSGNGAADQARWVSVEVLDAAGMKSMAYKEYPIASSNRPDTLDISVR